MFATCLPRWLNWPIVLAFLEPIAHSGHFGIQMMGLLNGERLNRRLVRCYDGFFVQVFISASPFLLSELFQNASLVADTLHTSVALWLKLFPFRAGKESTSLFALDGYHLAALRGTAT